MTKSNFQEPVLLLLLLLFLPISSVSGLGSVLVKQFTYIQNYSTWQDAQLYCRSSEDYTDLAIISEQSEEDSLYLMLYYAWIDTSKQQSSDFSLVWHKGKKFSGGDASNSVDGCAYVTFNKEFYVTDCGEYYFFICYTSEGNNYKFISQAMTWSDAQHYCQDSYDGLAVFKDSGDLYSAIDPQDFPVWIGLYKDGETWKWSTGESEYRDWAPKQPGNDGDCVTITSMSKKMITQSCSTRYPFLCFKDNLVLVRENKTWEEALEYCKNFSYQLVSVQPGDDYSYMKDGIMEADTEEVWTGLRYLAGNWMWVNGADMLFSNLPYCPRNEQNCGALSKNDTDGFETRDCSETKNFLCYSQW